MCDLLSAVARTRPPCFAMLFVRRAPPLRLRCVRAQPPPRARDRGGDRARHRQPAGAAGDRRRAGLGSLILSASSVAGTALVLTAHAVLSAVGPALFGPAGPAERLALRRCAPNAGR